MEEARDEGAVDADVRRRVVPPGLRRIRDRVPDADVPGRLHRRRVLEPGHVRGHHVDDAEVLEIVRLRELDVLIELRVREGVVDVVEVLVIEGVVDPLEVAAVRGHGNCIHYPAGRLGTVETRCAGSRSSL